MAFYNYRNVSSSINGSGVFLTNLSLSENASLSPLYIANERHSKSYAPTNGLESVCSLVYPLTGADPIKAFVTNETGVISGNFGGLYFNSGYLRSYSLSCVPNKSVVASAEIVFFDELKGVFNPSYKNVEGETPILNFSNITLTDPSNGSIGQINNVTNIEYTFSSEIEPLFVTDETTPTRIVFGRKEISASFQSDNLSGNLPVSGLAGGINISFSHPHIASLTESFSCSGRLYQRTISTAAGELLRSQITIKQNYVDNPPIILRFNPTGAATGTYIQISGSNLASTSQVFFHDLEAQFFVISDSIISGVVPENAVSGDIKVVNAGGSLNTGLFNVEYSPITATRLIEPTGAISGKMTISGSNFYRITNVKFAPFIDSEFSVVSPYLIQATIPLDAAWGNIDIISTTRNISGQSTQKFVPVPRIDGFTPVSGGSGALITFSGYGFSGVTGVLFNNLPNIEPFTTKFGIIGQNTGITGEVPTGNTKGTIKFLGQSGVIGTSVHTFFPLVNITGTSPTSAKTGVAIDILGNNFLSDLMYEVGSNDFLVGFNQVTGLFKKVNAGRLTGLIPYGAKTGPVYIYNPDLNVYPSNTKFTLVNEAPIIDYISPTSGYSSGFATVYGSNFYNISAVKLSGYQVITTLNNPSPTIGELGDTISFKIPQLTGGHYTLIINATDGDATGNSIIHVLGSGIFSGLTPTSGAIGQRITITGRDIYNNSKVFFNTTGTSGVEATVDHTSFNSNYSQLVFYVPFGVKTGVNDVFLYNTVNWTSGDDSFRLIVRPLISGFNPASGEYGQTISISGSNMGNVTGISVGAGYFSTSFTPVPETGCDFTIPEDAVTDFITIYSQAGDDTSTKKLSVLIPLPTFSGFTPTSGYYGDQIIISGLRLNTVNAVRLTGNNNTIISLEEPKFTKVGNTGINFLIPIGTASGAIQLKNIRGLTGSSYLLDILTTPEISGFSPYYGKFEDTINITGINLTGMTFVFKGVNSGTYVAGTNTIYDGNTGVTIKVPKEIIRSPIYVSGRGRIFSASPNSFTPLPTFSGFNLPSIATGDTFTITGINAAEVLDRLFITGASNNFQQILSGNFTRNLTNISGMGITNYTTGYTILTGAKVGDWFAGTGFLVLVNQYYSSVTDNDTFKSSEFGSQVDSIKSPSPFTITESAPTVTTFEPGSGNHNTTFTLNGFGLATTTGVYFFSGTYYQTGFIQTKSTRVVTVTGPTGYVERSGSIQVYTEYGNATYKENGSNKGLFTRIDSPYISGFTPTENPTGVYVRISGSGMRDVTGVYFGDYLTTFTTGVHGASDLYVCSGLVPYVTERLPIQFYIKVYNQAGNYTSSQLFKILPGDQYFYGNVIVSGGGIYQSGNPVVKLLQYISTSSSTRDSTTSTIPFDNTAPLSSEGAAFASLDTTITPVNLTNKLEVVAEVLTAAGASNFSVIGALFRGFENEAIAATSATTQNAEELVPITLKWIGTPTGLTPHTFAFRYGINGASTAYINRTAGQATLFGDAGISTMTIKEYAP